MKKFVAGGEFEGTFLKPKFGDASGVRGAARLARTTNYWLVNKIHLLQKELII